MALSPENRDKADALNSAPTEADRDPDVATDTDFNDLADFDDDGVIPMSDILGEEVADGDGEPEAHADGEAEVEIPEDAGEAESEEPADGVEAEAEPEGEPEVVEPVPAAAAPSEPAPAPEPAPRPQLTPEQAAQARREWIDTSSRQLAETEFALTEEMIEQLETEPEKVLPLLAGRAMVLAIEATTQTVLEQLPGIVLGVNESKKQMDSHENAFYESWPALQDPQYQELVFRHGGAYRAANPGASAEQFIKEVGTMVSITAGLPLNLPEGDVAVRQAKAPAPAKPHRPARTASAAAPTKGQPQYANEFDELFEMDIDL